MKKVIILIVLVFSISLYSNVDERLSDVYFANGIDTSKKQAIKVKNTFLVPKSCLGMQTSTPTLKIAK